MTNKKNSTSMRVIAGWIWAPPGWKVFGKPPIKNFAAENDMAKVNAARKNLSLSWVAARRTKKGVKKITAIVNLRGSPTRTKIPKLVSIAKITIIRFL